MRVIRREGMEKLDRKGYRVLKCLEEEIKGENMGIFHTIVPAGKKVSMHFHPLAKEVLIFLSSGEMMGAGGRVNVKPMEIAVLEPGEKHEIYGPSSLIAIKIPNIEGDKVLAGDNVRVDRYGKEYAS